MMGNFVRGTSYRALFVTRATGVQVGASVRDGVRDLERGRLSGDDLGGILTPEADGRTKPRR